MDILLIKLKKDLSEQLMEYVKEKRYPEIDVDTLIDEKVKPELFQFQSLVYDETKCYARLWDKGYQCTHNKKDDTDYCDKHLGMLRAYSVLRFGDIREPKPKYDQVKLKEGNKVKLNWIHPDPLIRLQTLLDKHQTKVINACPKLVVR